MSDNDIRVYVSDDLVATITCNGPTETIGGHTFRTPMKTAFAPVFWSDLSENILYQLRITNEKIENFEPILDCLQDLPIMCQRTYPTIKPI